MTQATAPALAPAPDLEDASAEEVLAHLLDRFHPRLYVAASFQKETAVIMDMALELEPSARFFTLDTGVLFPETYATWRAAEERYGITVDVYEGMSLARQSALEGESLWASDPDRCCGIRKVRPLTDALAGVEAWVTGLRRDQSPARRHSPKLGWDARHSVWKANPLAEWTEADVWTYVTERGLPYNPLHDRGYASIGCTHCTLPAAGREGRWAGREKSECGLHD